MSAVDESIVAGGHMGRSLGDFSRACETYIQEESRKLLPDTHVISLLCDAVRLTREMAVLRGLIERGWLETTHEGSDADIKA